MKSMSFSEQQHNPDLTHTSTKLTKLITVLPILYYFQILSKWVQFKVNHQRPKFVMRRPELKIPTQAKRLIFPLVCVIIKICKKHLVLKTYSNVNICNET